MINENRVKRMYKAALYEQKEEKEKQRIEQYFRSDYIGKEVIKSIFTGSIVYLAVAALWVMGNCSVLLEQINNLEIVNTFIDLFLFYVLFLFLYLIITRVVYAVRYKHSKAKHDAYVKNLKRIYQMYEREEKLKS